jgi:hypothetical protein
MDGKQHNIVIAGFFHFMNRNRVKNAMRRIAVTLSAVFMIFYPSGYGKAAGEPTASAQEIDFYAATVVPTMNKVKNAMPPAPVGWVVAGETKSDPLPRSAHDQTAPFLNFIYQITYERTAGIREEKKKLNAVYRESAEKNGEAANPRIEALLKQQTTTSLALRKAARRKNQAEMQRLNDELDENGRKMRAVHEEVAEKISRDVDPYLIKDAEAIIRVAVNAEVFETGRGEPLSVPGAAFAFRLEGERTGPAAWKEGRTVILYGNWQQSGNGMFRAQVQRTSVAVKAQTIKITLTGDKKRTEELLKQLDKKSILSLMK